MYRFHLLRIFLTEVRSLQIKQRQDTDVITMPKKTALFSKMLQWMSSSIKVLLLLGKPVLGCRKASDWLPVVIRGANWWPVGHNTALL